MFKCFMIVLIAGHSQLNSGEPVYYGLEETVGIFNTEREADSAHNLLDAVDYFRSNGLKTLEEMVGDPGIFKSHRLGEAYGCYSTLNGDYSNYRINIDKEIVKSLVSDHKYFYKD